jgi:hypothetical protein
MCCRAALSLVYGSSWMPPHRALPWADDHTLPHQEVRCAPQQNSHYADTAYGSAETLEWIVNDKKIGFA